jgi:N-sulfoglucosamine sulfohydrolase
MDSATSPADNRYPMSTISMRVLAVLSVVLGVTSIASAAAAPARPHVVLFIADDYSWHDCGPYGGKDVRTPNLDRLATQSMRFDAAFAASPTCVPSRSAIYTGLYPFRNGAHANHSLVRDGVRSLPQHMAGLGYRVVIAGKTHVGPRAAFPFEYLDDSNVMPPGKNHVLWTDLNTAAVDGLLKSHDRAKPLCLVVCAHSPHVYWPDDVDGYDPAKVAVPPYLLDSPETRAARCKYLADVTHMDRQLGDVAASLDRHGYADGTLLAFTADQGAQFPFAKWNVYDAGIRVPLLVRWPGRVKPGTSTAALVSLVDLLPTMIDAAGGKPPHDDVDGRSFLPVLLGRADRHHDAVFAAHTGDGQMNRSPQRAVRTARFKLIHNLLPDAPHKTHISDGAGVDGRSYWDAWVKRAETDVAAAAVVRRYRQRPAEELYDLAADPYEQRDLSADPAHAATLAELRETLRAWRVRQSDDPAKVPMPEDARKGPIPYAKWGPAPTTNPR